MHVPSIKKVVGACKSYLIIFKSLKKCMSLTAKKALEHASASKYKQNCMSQTPESTKGHAYKKADHQNGISLRDIVIR